MSLLKNSIYILLLFILLINITGCKSYDFETNNINIEDIYNQEEDEYYVYFYMDDCKYCEDCFDTVLEYLNNPLDLKLYVCKVNKNDIIKRFYEGEDGQGESGGYFVDGVTDYNDLYISGVPSLIKIDITNTSYFVTSGRKKIIAYFNDMK